MKAREEISAKKLSYTIVGSGTTVLSQLPAAGTSLYNGGTVIIYTDTSGEQSATVPNLIGLTATEVNTAAASAGINIVFAGNTTSPDLRSYSQSVTAGTQVALGEVITVYFRDEGNADMTPQQ
jgi:beta-lactam-binding protein with PASTA domain